MLQDLLNLIQEKSPGAKPLLLVIRGSHAYGTNLPTSDIDYSGVFIQSQDDIYGLNYMEQINDDKNDIIIYEIRRFLELLAKNNPTVLELLNTPEECILYKDEIFNLVIDNKMNFITKICSNSFGGYAKTQIQKAKGQNKKQNWEKDKVIRKEVIDFVYVIEGEKSIPWIEWSKGKYDVKFCGLSNVPNARDVYAVFYDKIAHNCFSELVDETKRNETKNIIKSLIELGNVSLSYGFGYKGIVKTGEGNSISESNQLRLSSIPKSELPICNIVYNKDAYTQHCNDYRSYQTWLEERNVSRWVDVKSHGQKIDGKNMMHCRRLVDMAREIGEGKGIIVKRPNASELISIRKGEVDLQTLINHVESEIIEIDNIFKNSDLPDSLDRNFINSLLIKIRKYIYN